MVVGVVMVVVIGTAVMSMFSVMPMVRRWMAMAVATIMSIERAQSGSFGMISVSSVMTSSNSRVIR